MKFDLHCHSLISDGLLAPSSVVERAARNGLQLLALTDHDDMSGLPEAHHAALACGIRLIDGVEVSATWRDAGGNDTTVHVIGLGIDPHDTPLNLGLRSIRQGREARAATMAAALARVGIPDALEGAARYAKNANIIGRAHFARYLVEYGAARDIHAVFESYLVKGKPGYVSHSWATLQESVKWITGAGGIAVMAHPGRYRMSRQELRHLLGEFKEAGGTGIEVLSGSHDPEQVREMANLARHFGFLASAASDFHGPGESRVDLGELPGLPEDLTPIWHNLV